jgi:DNA polymerase III epsilon subunit-like protein
MKLRRKLLILDTETSGLPMTRSKVPKHVKYPNPKFSFAYDSARILSLAYIAVDYSVSSDIIASNYLIRNNSDLDKKKYTTNQDKYPDKTGSNIKDILNDLNKWIDWCDCVVGHNILFDMNIILHEMIICNISSNIESKLNKSQYFCTLDEASRLCSSGRDLNLQSFYMLMNSGSEYSDQKITFHEALDDVKAVKIIVERIMDNSYEIPSGILEIIEEIYPSTEIIHEGISTHELILSSSETLFHFYIKRIDFVTAKCNAAGTLRFGLTDEQLQSINLSNLYTNSGLYSLDGESGYCRIGGSSIFKCDCGNEEIDYEICEACGDSTSILEKYYNIPTEINTFCLYSIAEVKDRVPKDKGRRSKTITLKVVKKGRSNYVSSNAVDYYIDNKLYIYFSLLIGKTKV